MCTSTTFICAVGHGDREFYGLIIFSDDTLKEGKKEAEKEYLFFASNCLIDNITTMISAQGTIIRQKWESLPYFRTNEILHSPSIY